MLATECNASPLAVPANMGSSATSSLRCYPARCIGTPTPGSAGKDRSLGLVLQLEVMIRPLDAVFALPLSWFSSSYWQMLRRFSMRESPASTISAAFLLRHIQGDANFPILAFPTYDSRSNRWNV